MGRLFEEEFSVVSGVMENPKRPCVFVLGGAKIQDAFMMMNAVCERGAADLILTGGLVSNIMFLARGVDIGEPSTEYIHRNSLEEFVPVAKGILEKYPDKIILPSDLAYSENNERRELGVKDLPRDVLLADIGHETVGLYRTIIREAGTVFINGPMGIFENEASEYGTKAVWEATASSRCYSVLGGGDSIAAANKYGVEKGITYICTGGGALVRFLSGEELPVVRALRNAAKRFGRG
jgi:phosphoglycerate kinase